MSWLQTEQSRPVLLLPLTVQSDSSANKVLANLLLQDVHLAHMETQQDILDNLAVRLAILNFTVLKLECQLQPVIITPISVLTAISVMQDLTHQLVLAHVPLITSAMLVYQQFVPLASTQKKQVRSPLPSVLTVHLASTVPITLKVS